MMKKELSEFEKRRKERQRRIRKRRLIIFFFFLLVICSAVFVVLLKTRLFPVKNIKATGSALYSNQEIISASGINSKTPLFGINKKTVGDKISKKLTYIESVKVKKTFPDTILITVSDAEEYYAFETDDGYFVTSKSGKVLNFYVEKPESTIGVKADGVKLKKGQDVSFKNATQKELFDFLMSYTEEKGIRVNSIDISDMVHITILVEDKFNVNLGNRENLKEKINHLAGMIPEIGDRKGSINLDMWSKSDSKGTFIVDN